MPKADGLHAFKRSLGGQTNRERCWRECHGASQPAFVVYELLHPRAHIGRGDVDKLKRRHPRVKPLFFQQMRFGARAVKDRNNGLSVVHHIAVQFHQFALLSRAEQKKCGSGGLWVPYFAPPSGSLIEKLAGGHVWNQRSYAHAATGLLDVVPTFYPAVGINWVQ